MRKHQLVTHMYRGALLVVITPKICFKMRLGASGLSRKGWEWWLLFRTGALYCALRTTTRQGLGLRLYSIIKLEMKFIRWIGVMVVKVVKAIVF